MQGLSGLCKCSLAIVVKVKCEGEMKRSYRIWVKRTGNHGQILNNEFIGLTFKVNLLTTVFKFTEGQ